MSEEFGKRLQAARIARGFHFVEGAAEATGITVEQWAAVESGASPPDVLGDDTVR